MKEHPIFPIHKKAVYDTYEARANLGPAKYFSSTLRIFQYGHTDLYEYIESTGRSLPEDSLSGYMDGITNTYDVVTNALAANQETIEITQDDIAVHTVNRADQRIDQVTGEDIGLWLIIEALNPEHRAFTAVEKVMEKIRSSSPELYAEIIDQLTNHISGIENRCAYFSGIYDAFMPFYNKKEAAHLDLTLITAPRLEKGIKSGYYTDEIS